MDEGYYRLIKPLKGFEDREGDLFYLSEIEEEFVYFLQGDSTWHTEIENLNRFEFVPDGVQERAREMAALMEGLQDIGNDNERILLQSDQLLLLPGIEPVSKVNAALAPVNKALSPNLVKNQLKEMKTQIGKTKMLIEKKQRELKRIVEEQEAILEKKVTALSKQIKAANEAIGIITTYLGQDEEIVQIKKGKPAPKETMITIRQSILYMDEECLVAADKGGIDFQNIEEFDKWIVKPAHLQQVLPEEKGIVALKVRRKDKDYGDWYSNAANNELNKELYILIRNGGTVYRIYTTLRLDKMLLPTKQEFEEFFFEDKTDWKTHKTTRVPLNPGTRRYTEAMEKAEKNQKRYFKVLILLQGLLDRTKVFQPMPVEERINLCNISECDEYIRVIYDGEDLLGDGRPYYDDWIANANNQLDVGHRVIGKFDHYASRYDDINKRITPSRAGRPDCNKLYTIEQKRDKDTYIFRYERDETIYTNWGYRGHKAKRRASFKCHPRDGFILNFDTVTCEEIEYYLTSRIHRHHYLEMVPLLKVAIELKKREREEEAPFRLLLIGEIAKAAKVSHEEAEVGIDELIHWWKFKNLTHRALTSDDSKAVRMIVAEFIKRKELAEQNKGKTASHQKAIEALKSSQTVAIWFRQDNEYVVFDSYNNENVFVRERQFLIKNDKFVVDYDKEWQVVDSRHKSWQLLFAHERWKDWAINARSNDHLTDPEREAAITLLLNSLVPAKELKKKTKRDRHHSDWLLPLAITLQEKGGICVWFANNHIHYDPKHPLTGSIIEPETGYVEMKWEKKRSGVSFYPDTRTICTCELDNPPWSGTYDGCLWEGKQVQRTLRVYEENIESLRKEVAQVKILEDQAEELAKDHRIYSDQVNDALKAKFYEAEKLKYFEEYADEEMWLEHKKTIRYPSHHWPSWVGTALDFLVERGNDPNGMTIGRVVELALSYGAELDKEDYENVVDIVLDKTYTEEEEEINNDD